jgi:hypothetical protein
MLILSTTNHSIAVQSKAGKRYEYIHFNPFQQRKLKRFLKQGYEGRAWNLLKKYQIWKKM